MTTSVRGFDCHCHIDLFPEPAAAVADREHHRIVTLAVTTTPKAWAQNRRWTAGSNFVFSGVGLHPELAGQRHGEAAVLEGLIGETRLVGEIGLDGSPQHKGSRAAQIDVFTRALKASETAGGRVLSIHSRRAAKEVLRCLSDFTSPTRVLPILHWFSDSAATARQAVELGCYFSINHRMLETAAGALLIKSLPLDRILTETDAPFTNSNERSGDALDVYHATVGLSNLLTLTGDAVQETLATNAKRVFQFAGIALPA